MIRKLNSEIFSSATHVLGCQVEKTDNLGYALWNAKFKNGSDEFVDEETSQEYSTILQMINQRNERLIEHEQYLKKRGTLLRDSDSEAANLLTDAINTFKLSADEINILSQNMKECERQANTGVININVLYSQQEIDYISNPFPEYSYESFLAMTPAEKIQFQNQILNYIKAVYMSGLLPMPSDNKISIVIAPGVTVYYSVDNSIAIENSHISVSYNTSADVGMQLLTTADFTELDEKTLAASLSNSGEISVEYDDTYGGSTIYSAVKVDILNRVYSVEHGVTVESPAVSYNGADVKDSVTMAFGVEITAPPDWKEQEEIQDVNSYETYEKVVVVAGVAYVIYRVGRVVVATCVGGPVLGGVAAVAP